MALVPDQKFSTFQVGGTPTTGDIIVGLRGGINTKFNWVLPAGIDSITGTANQVLVDGTSGTPVTGDVTLTTPQDIATTSSPTFAGLTVGNLHLAGNTISSLDSNGNVLIIPNGSGATQGITQFGSSTLIGSDNTSLIQATSVNRGAILSLMTNWNANAGAGIYLSTSRSAVPGTLSPVVNGQIISQIINRGDDGVTGLIEAAAIEAIANGTISSGIVPGKFNFYTSNSSGVRTLGMSLDSSQVLTLANPLLGSSGGTGINNGTKTITLGGNLTTSGAFNSTFTMTGATNVTFPTSGTLATTSGTVSSVSGTLNRITSTGGTTPVIDISAAYVGQTSITTLGTIATGVWQGTLVGATYGGTGVNNGSNTLTLAGTLATSGSFASVFTMTGATNVTFPTSGTLATTASASGVINSGTTNQLAYYAASGTTLSGLSTANNGILVTSSGGVPSIGNTVGAGLTMPSITFNSTTGIVGTTTNDNAASGSVGQVVSSSVASGSPVPLTNGTPADITSISLTAGDWDVYPNVMFVSAGAGFTLGNAVGWASTTSATLPALEETALLNNGAGGLLIGAVAYGFTAPFQRLSLASTTTVYLSTQSNFSTGTVGAFGRIYARRRR